ncbi:MAG: LuxR C-terminal-related transcriptional regulator [Lachnospira sp.]
MAHLKHLNRAYLSKRLKDALETFEEYRYNFICAPTGYGKSMVCRTFFKNNPKFTILWIDANTKKEVFWNNLCNALKIVNPSYSSQLSLIGFPESEDDINKIKNILSSFPAEKPHVMIIIDNFDNYMNDIICRIISTCYSDNSMGIRYVFNISEIHNPDVINLITKQETGFVGKELLKFDHEDIYDFFRMNEIIIDRETAKTIYNETLGWPYVVELYVESNKQGNTSVLLDKCDEFINTNLWYNLDGEHKDFLLNLSIFDKFTTSQCMAQTLLDEHTCLLYLRKTPIIEYDSHKKVYYFNPVFLHFLKGIFNQKPLSEINEATLRAANTYLSNGNYFNAIKLYNSCGEYEKIYTSNTTLRSIYGYIIKENKDLFFEIANHYWETDKHGNYKFSIIICFIMFMYNEKNTMQSLMKDIHNDIENDDSLNDSVRASHYAELEFINAFSSYNDFAKMNESFKKVASITKSPINTLAGQYPFTFECPSIMSMYHRKSGALDVEMLTLEDCAPNYYRITNGHGKGFEALMKAEVLYNRGEIESAEILCHKAIYMADSRNQHSIYIAATYILALISIYHGANDAYKEYMNNMTRKLDSTDFVSSHMGKMVDLCKSLIFSNLGEPDKIANWLKDEKSIEDNTNFLSLSFINIILGKYLILTEDYHHFLGISGQLLGLSKVYSYIVPRIYTYIYLAIANNETGEYEKAHKFLTEALELAVHDKLYMPFVHNYSYIDSMLDESGVSKNMSAFVKNIHKYSKTYEKGVKSIKKAGRLLANYGLTVREADVAKLAAQRLTNKEIAEQLFIAESTVKSNMKVIFNKLQINSRSELKNFFD